MTVIVEEAGKALVPGPFFTSALLAAPLLIEGGSDPQKKEFLPRMAKGKFIATVAMAEASGRLDADGIQLKATKSGSDYTLTGEKFFVPDAHVADGIAVAVRTGGSGEEGITFLALNAKNGRHHHPAQDRRYDAANVPREIRQRQGFRTFGKEDDGWPVLRRTLEVATAVLSTEMVGTAQKALDIAVEYAKTRVQFGKPIGSFQAVKHKCVDMMVAVENARSLTYYACWTVDRRRRSSDRRPDGQGVCLRHGQERDLRSDPGPRRHRLHLGARHASVPSARARRRSEPRQRPGPSRDRRKSLLG